MNNELVEKYVIIVAKNFAHLNINDVVILLLFDKNYAVSFFYLNLLIFLVHTYQRLKKFVWYVNIFLPR